MLVLTRKLGENIRIGDAVKITVLEVRSGQVKLGIEAPPEVKVHREESYARIQQEKKDAAQRPTGTDPGKKWEREAPPAHDRRCHDDHEHATSTQRNRRPRHGEDPAAL